MTTALDIPTLRVSIIANLQTSGTSISNNTNLTPELTLATLASTNWKQTLVSKETNFKSLFRSCSLLTSYRSYHPTSSSRSSVLHAGSPLSPCHGVSLRLLPAWCRILLVWLYADCSLELLKEAYSLEWQFTSLSSTLSVNSLSELDTSLCLLL